jgi:hypothetical protein
MSFEKWDESQQFIMPCEARPIPFTISEEQNKRILEKLDLMEDVSKALGLASTNIEVAREGAAELSQICADQLLSQELIDPAFAYAIKRAGFIPRLHSRLLLTLHPDVIFTGRKAEHAVNESRLNYSAAGML